MLMFECSGGIGNQTDLRLMILILMMLLLYSIFIFMIYRRISIYYKIDATPLHRNFVLTFDMTDKCFTSPPPRTTCVRIPIQFKSARGRPAMSWDWWQWQPDFWPVWGGTEAEGWWRSDAHTEDLSDAAWDWPLEPPPPPDSVVENNVDVAELPIFKSLG